MKERFKITTAAYLILTKDNKILLSLRENTSFMDAMWGLPSGHLEENETIADACVREIKEEINLDIDKKDLELSTTIFRNCKNIGGNDYLVFFFTTDKYSGILKNNEENKCGGLEFFDIDNLPKNIIEYIKIAINNYLNNINYSEYSHSL